MIRHLLVVAVVGLLAAGSVATRAADQKPFKVTLNFLAGGPQAAFPFGKKLGLFSDAGIDLTIEEGRGSATTAALVTTGQTDAGLADAPGAMQVRAKGGPLTIIATTNDFLLANVARCWA